MRIKISKIAKDLNVGVGTVVDFLAKHNIIVENNPNARVDEKAEALLMTEFSSDKADKSLVDNTIDKRKADRKEKADRRSAGGSASGPVRQAPGLKVLGKIDLSAVSTVGHGIRQKN